MTDSADVAPGHVPRLRRHEARRGRPRRRRGRRAGPRDARRATSPTRRSTAPAATWPAPGSSTTRPSSSAPTGSWSWSAGSSALDEPLRWPERIARVTPRQVRRAARRHIDPSALVRVEYGPIRRRGQSPAPVRLTFPWDEFPFTAILTQVRGVSRKARAIQMACWASCSRRPWTIWPGSILVFNGQPPVTRRGRSRAAPAGAPRPRPPWPAARHQRGARPRLAPPSDRGRRRSRAAPSGSPKSITSESAGQCHERSSTWQRSDASTTPAPARRQASTNPSAP